jgi:hypothetical protein
VIYSSLIHRDYERKQLELVSFPHMHHTSEPGLILWWQIGGWEFKVRFRMKHIARDGDVVII